MPTGFRGPSRLKDRREAGQRLAERLVRFEAEKPLLLALPRGGVPVAFEIARRLHTPLDVLIVRKIGAPGNPEYGLGAVVEGGYQYLDTPRVFEAGLTESDLRRTIEEERREVERRSLTYRDHRPREPLEGRFVILVDDGVATGGTVVAATRAVRAAKARRIVIALGVCPPESYEILKREADEVVSLMLPRPFFAVGEWYDDFAPVSDEEVIRLLRESQ